MKIKFTYLFIIFTLISSNDFGFYYDNSKDAIYLDPKYNNSESIIPNTNSIRQHYYSSAGKNKFDIEYYSCDTSLNMSLDLIKVEYTLPEFEDVRIKEIILDMDKLTGNAFPKKYENVFTVTQKKESSVKGKDKRGTIIYDTFGFNVKSKSGLNFKITKILLVNFRKDKLNYLANLSYNLHKQTDNSFDIHLKDMPEDFDLYITLDLYDENGEAKDEKVLLVEKEFNYPNYKIESSNPNKKLFIISIIVIGITFILIAILAVIKIIIG